FTAQRGVLLRIELAAHLNKGSLDFGLFDGASEIAGSSNPYIDDGETGTLTHSIETSDVYYLAVWSSNTAQGNYDIVFDGTLPAPVGDTTPPEGSLLVEMGTDRTRSMDVLLYLSCSDVTTRESGQMQLSNDGVTWSLPEPFAPVTAWALEGGDGAKTVFARVSDAAGNWSVPFTDGITLDTTSPTIAGLDDDSVPTKENTWTWEADETSTFRFAIDQNPNGTPGGPYGDNSSATQSSGNGTYYLHVQARDEAGNQGPVRTVSAILDNTPPVITSLATDADPCKSKTWTWGSIDADPSVCFRHVIDQHGAGSQLTDAYTALNTATVDGVDGIWYLHVQAQDRAGNESSIKTVAVLMDNTAPNTEIEYSPALPTWNEVMATLLPDEPVVVVNNDGELAHPFQANGQFAFELSDPAGNTSSVTATVNWIAALSWGSPASVFYGQPLDAGQLNATSNVSGTFEYEPPPATVLPVGTHALTLTFTPEANSGLSPQQRTVFLTIEPAPLLCTADDKSKVYGSANPALTISYTGLKNGETAPATPPGAACAADVASGVGTYPITLTDGSDPNYALRLQGGTLSVTRNLLTVTAEDKSRLYGDSNPAFTVSYEGFVNDDDADDLATQPVAICTADAASGAGAYDVVPGEGVDENYAFNYVNGTLWVTEKLLTVTAEDKSRLYGDANPGFTVSYDGFVNDDDAGDLTTQPTASSDAVPGSGVSTYDIASDGGVDENYVFSYVNGTLTVDPAPLTCTADDKSKVYGSANPDLTISYDGLKNDDLAPATPPAIACAASETNPVGTYAITLTGGGDPNYVLTLANGRLNVLAGTVFRLWVNDGEGTLVTLEFGETETASERVDAFDERRAGSAHTTLCACFVQDDVSDSEQRFLIRDFRPLSAVSRWLLVLPAAVGQEPLTLSWDVSAAQGERHLCLQEVRDEQAVGFPIDMRSVSSMETSSDAIFEIAYSPATETIVTMERGWNLVGNPAMSTQSTGAIFDDGARAAINVGVVWYWNNGRYEVWSRDGPLSPELGYWVYCPADRETALITGVRADGIILLEPGWNLVSSASDCVMPAGDGIAGPAWCWDSHAYRAVTTGSTLQTGQGYWIYVGSDEPVMIHLGE
ncbi:MAG: MBG-2 domain-containing protein, partial [Lentisphaerae bacterium]|nr:MBG-2 domain-containing protein [Lentisphaerota bacterium]